MLKSHRWIRLSQSHLGSDRFAKSRSERLFEQWFLIFFLLAEERVASCSFVFLPNRAHINPENNMNNVYAENSMNKVYANFQCNGMTRSNTRCKTMKRALTQASAYCKRHQHLQPLSHLSSFDQQISSFDQQMAYSPPMSPSNDDVKMFDAPPKAYHSGNSLLEDRLVELSRTCNATPHLIVYLQRRYMNMRDGAASLIGTLMLDDDEDDVGSSVSNHSDGARPVLQSRGPSALGEAFRFVFRVIAMILFVKFAVNANLSTFSSVVDAIANADSSTADLIANMLSNAALTNSSMVSSSSFL